MLTPFAWQRETFPRMHYFSRFRGNKDFICLCFSYHFPIDTVTWKMRAKNEINRWIINNEATLIRWEEKLLCKILTHFQRSIIWAWLSDWAVCSSGVPGWSWEQPQAETGNQFPYKYKPFTSGRPCSFRCLLSSMKLVSHSFRSSIFFLLKAWMLQNEK